jgi:GH24 family phage-related lysozyme (muramidase)
MQPMSSKAGLGAAGLIDMSSFDLERQLSFKKKSYEDIAIDFIKDKESYGKAPDHDKVFDDFGTDRIGYGRSPDPGETTTTRAKEDTWLQSYVKDLGDFIDDVVTINLLPNQKAALISLVFNVGKDAFKISYALKALNLGDMEEFKKQAFSKNHGFVTSNGNYVPGLYNRRQSEQDLFFN